MQVGNLLRALIILVGVAAAASCGGPAGRDDQGAEGATVARVVDGDTIVLTDERRVRLIGIDTPETVHPSKPVECFGKEASAYLSSLLPPGTAVRLAYDVDEIDRYGRTLAYVYRADDGLFVNLDLAEGGYAQQLTITPNVAHADEFGDAVERARNQEAGLWGQVCNGA